MRARFFLYVEILEEAGGDVSYSNDITESFVRCTLKAMGNGLFALVAIVERYGAIEVAPWCRFRIRSWTAHLEVGGDDIEVEKHCFCTRY